MHEQLHASGRVGNRNIQTSCEFLSGNTMELLTVREVQMQLKVSRACVYSLIESGDLPCVRIGIGRGTIRIDQEDVYQFVEKRRKPHAKKKRIPAARAAFEHLDADKLRRAWTGDEKQ